MKKLQQHSPAAHWMKITYCLGFLLLATALVAHAQGGLTDPGGDVDAPIDGGLSLLVAAGVGYGAKKLKERKAAAKLEKESAEK